MIKEISQSDNKFSVPIAEERKSSVTKIFVWIMLFVWGAVYFAKSDKVAYFQTVFISACIISVVVILLHESQKLRKNNITFFGEFTLTETAFIVQRDGEIIRFAYDDLSSLILNIEETSRDKWDEGSAGSSFRGRKSGVNNWAEISTKGQELSKYQLYFYSDREIKLLDTFLRTLNRKNVIVKRRYEKVESILERHYKDYPPHYWDTSPKD